MDTADSPQVIRSIEEQLSALFGSYRAEWLKGQIFDLYTEPQYFPALTTSRPCALVGGRGTGKTTVLLGLSYEGQFALHQRDSASIPNWPYYGVYYRVNTNRVTAFQGPSLHTSQWTKLFAHYFNLIVCENLIGFLNWFNEHCPGYPRLPAEQCNDLAVSLHLPPCHSLDDLARQLPRARLGFEAQLNNVADGLERALSLQGAPIDLLMESVSRLPQFKGKNFFVLIDEYENFDNVQQQVLNTLIKHCGDKYTFKIGIKELGWRCKTTLNDTELLISPADYVLVNIADVLSDVAFKDFAARVCDDRLARLLLPESERPLSVREALETISAEEEATLLGIDERVSAIRETIVDAAAQEELDHFDNAKPLMAYLLDFWSDTPKQLIESIQHYIRDPQEWEERLGNYKYTLLFTINRGKRGIHKYFAGWDVITKISGNNIRYLLELIDNSLLLHVRNGGRLSQPVSAKTQTIAAQNVGKKNLAELDGLSVDGAKLTKLLLGMGRVFQHLAADAKGHTPEANQFQVTHLDQNASACVDLLKSAVMHLALVRYPGTKLQTENDTASYDYSIHPVFAPFFEISHRRKRKVHVTASELLGLIDNHRSAIRSILSNMNRSVDVLEPLPDQMLLFEKYFHGP